MAWDTLSYLHNDILTKVNKPIMALLLETGAPFFRLPRGPGSLPPAHCHESPQQHTHMESPTNTLLVSPARFHRAPQGWRHVDPSVAPRPSALLGQLDALSLSLRPRGVFATRADPTPLAAASERPLRPHNQNLHGVDVAIMAGAEVDLI